MFVSYKDKSVRLTGRWDKRGEKYAQTTATGSYIEFAFEGNMLVALFDVENNMAPFPHLWIQVDDGPMIEAPLDAYLRIMIPNSGRHVCRIIYKGSVEVHRRWYQPLVGKISFRGFEAEKTCELPPDNRQIIEFVGDSITEGVLIDTDYFGDGVPQYPDDMDNRVYQDDACATYAWLTAQKLNMRSVIMGYGAVGVTHAGQGDVPAAYISYPCNYDGSPISHELADIIVINHGTNDYQSTVEEFLRDYEQTLDAIRGCNEKATVVILTPFCGNFHTELSKFALAYSQKNSCSVKCIDTYGWIPAEPIHPLRDGHRKVAENLAPLLKEILFQHNG